MKFFGFIIHNQINKINTHHMAATRSVCTSEGAEEAAVIVEDSCSIWGSVRLTYSICAFFAMMLHLCMRNAMSFAILCMVKSNFTHTAPSFAVQDEFQKCGEFNMNATNRISEYSEFYWTRSEEFLLLGCFYYGYLVALPIGGRLCDKFGGKMCFIHSLTLQAVLFMLSPVFARQSYVTLVVMRAIQGLVAGFGNPAIYQLYSVWAHPSERAALLSFGYGGYSVGSLLVLPLSSFLCHFGWSMVFYCIGSVSLAYGICCHWLIYSTLESHPRLTDEERKYLKAGNIHAKMPTIPWRSIFTSIAVNAFLVTHICHTFGIIVLTLLLPKFLNETMRFGLNETGIYSSVPFVGSCLSKVLMVALCKSIQSKLVRNFTLFRRRVYAGCNCLTILFLIGVILLDCSHKYLLVVLILFIGMTTDVAFSGAYWVSLLDCAPSFVGLLSGISNSLATLVSSFAPMGISKIIVLGSKSEWDMIFLLMISAYSLSAVVYGLWGSSELQPWAKQLKPEPNDHANNNNI